MRVEIIGRGPSRRAPNEDREQWWISTACGSLPPRTYELQGAKYHPAAWNLHAQNLWEKWFFPWPNRMIMSALNDKGVYVPEILPAGKLLETFGPVFASTVSWMLGHAVFLGNVDEILLNGVDWAVQGTDQKERMSLFYMVGMVRAMGIKVDHVKPTFFETGCYGL